MPFLVGCLALSFPRFAVFLVWLLGGNYLGRAYEARIWPLLGFLFFPLTTLAFAFGINSIGNPGEMTPLGWVLVGFSAATDIGIVRGGRSSGRRREGRGSEP